MQDDGQAIKLARRFAILRSIYCALRGKTIPVTGLGLSIVKHGAMLHEAEIKIENDGKSGTSVVFCIPIAD